MPPITPPGYEFHGLESLVSSTEEDLVALKTSTAKVRRLELTLRQFDDLRRTALADLEARRRAGDPIVDLDPFTASLERLEVAERAFTIQRESLLMYIDLKNEEIVDQIQRPSESPFLLLKEAAAYARCSETSVYDAVKEGNLKAAKVGNSYRFTKEELDRWLWADRS